MFASQTWGAINSSSARVSPNDLGVGFGPASGIFTSFRATFAGQSVNSGDILVRLATLGDANMDGTVNALDFNIVATNFGASGKSWFQGDFNYSGTVNTADFTLLAQHFGQAAPAPLPDAPHLLAQAPVATGLFSNQPIQVLDPMDADKNLL
jgi:hypothetical protein